MMGWIPEYVPCLSETVRTAEFPQGGKGAASDSLGCGDNPLEHHPVCSCAAGKPQTNAVHWNTLNVASVKGHKQFDRGGCYYESSENRVSAF